MKRPLLEKDSTWTHIRELAQEFNECLAVSIEYSLWWEAITPDQIEAVGVQRMEIVLRKMAGADRSRSPETRKKLLNEAGDIIAKAAHINGPDL